MKGKTKAAPQANGHGIELLDEIEQVLLNARVAKRPFTEYLLYMAFLEELNGSGREDKRPSQKSRARKP